MPMISLGPKGYSCSIGFLSQISSSRIITRSGEMISEIYTRQASSFKSDYADSNGNMTSSNDLASTTTPTVINDGVTRSRKILLMTVVAFLGMVNAFAGGTTLIGPKVQADLGFSTDELQWLSTSFYIPLVCRPWNGVFYCILSQL